MPLVTGQKARASLLNIPFPLGLTCAAKVRSCLCGAPTSRIGFGLTQTEMAQLECLSLTNHFHPSLIFARELRSGRLLALPVDIRLRKKVSWQ